MLVWMLPLGNSTMVLLRPAQSYACPSRGTIRREIARCAARRPGPPSTLEPDLINPLFEQRQGMADAVSGGNGLFLMPKQFIADIGRATGGPQPILRAMAPAVDHLARIDNATIV